MNQLVPAQQRGSIHRRFTNTPKMLSPVFLSNRAPRSTVEEGTDQASDLGFPYPMKRPWTSSLTSHVLKQSSFPIHKHLPDSGGLGGRRGLCPILDLRPPRLADSLRPTQIPAQQLSKFAYSTNRQREVFPCPAPSHLQCIALTNVTQGLPPVLPSWVPILCTCEEEMH